MRPAAAEPDGAEAEPVAPFGRRVVVVVAVQMVTLIALYLFGRHFS